MFTNTSNLPISVAVWLAHDDYDHSSDPYHVSATSLLKPIKSLVLSNRVATNSDTDVADLIASRMGTAVHTAIENAWLNSSRTETLHKLNYSQKLVNNIVINPSPSQITEDSVPIYMELRGSTKVGKYTVSGKFDFVSGGVLEDFKTTGTYGYINQSNAEKYIQQGSIYRWLHPEIITEDYMYIQYIFTDWSAAKARQDKNYPSSRIVPQRYVLKSVQDTEAFVVSRINMIDMYQDAAQSEIPDCTPEELWERAPVFKYYKNPESRARSTKNFTTYHEAHERMLQDGSVGVVVEIKGEVKFCSYCPAVSICKQAKGYIAAGRLVV
jgi:hypothetical protein|tara:strand:+ start:230 stop:1204 length:975 start_codon:yes stop_codon:yes gene_type:complete